MKVVSVICPACGRLNQMPGSDLELFNIPGGTKHACHACNADLDFSVARLEYYQEPLRV